MDLTQVEDIKKRWQEYTEELYRKDLHDPDNHDGVITHLEPDILECAVKWACPQFVVINTVKGFGTVNKAKVDVFLDLSCFFDDPVDVSILISHSSAFSKSSLNIWKFPVCILLKLHLENFEYWFASM